MEYDGHGEIPCVSISSRLFERGDNCVSSCKPLFNTMNVHTPLLEGLTSVVVPPQTCLPACTRFHCADLDSHFCFQRRLHAHLSQAMPLAARSHQRLLVHC